MYCYFSLDNKVWILLIHKQSPIQKTFLLCYNTITETINFVRSCFLAQRKCLSNMSWTNDFWKKKVYTHLHLYLTTLYWKYSCTNASINYIYIYISRYIESFINLSFFFLLLIYVQNKKRTWNNWLDTCISTLSFKKHFVQNI